MTEPENTTGQPAVPSAQAAPASQTASATAEKAAAAPKETSTVRWLIETAVLVGLAFLLAQGIKTYVVQPYIVPTGSMIPTIELRDRVLAEKISYRFRDPRQGEIVVFQNPDSSDPVAKILIKRVIAVGGQTVDLADGKVYVDGQPLAEPYVHGKVSDPGTVPMPVEVPTGYVWLMGDNRPNSGDSRFFGPQPVSAVDGRAFFTYWPPSRMGKLE
jgi:signal peptidase I